MAKKDQKANNSNYPAYDTGKNANGNSSSNSNENSNQSKNSKN